MKIVNLSKLVQYPVIDTKDGAQAKFRIMPKARVDLPEGATVNDHWLSSNPRTIQVLAERQTIFNVGIDQHSGDQ